MSPISGHEILCTFYFFTLILLEKFRIALETRLVDNVRFTDFVLSCSSTTPLKNLAGFITASLTLTLISLSLQQQIE